MRRRLRCLSLFPFDDFPLFSVNIYVKKVDYPTYGHVEIAFISLSENRIVEI